MPSHNEKYHSTYTPMQLFKIVGDVQSYPEFLPWVVGCRIIENSESLIIAELLIKFKAFKGSYTSNVILKPTTNNDKNSYIDVHLVKGPFKSLTNNWRFIANQDGTTNVEFHLDFEFKSTMLDKLLSKIYLTAVNKMVKAFEQRAVEIYG